MVGVELMMMLTSSAGHNDDVDVSSSIVFFSPHNHRIDNDYQSIKKRR